MVEVITTNKPPEEIHIQPGFGDYMKDNIKVVNALEGMFDKSITTQGLYKLHYAIKSGELPLYVEKEVGFQNKEKLLAFCGALVGFKTPIKIYTENIEFLNAINIQIAHRTKNNSVLIIDTHNFYHRSYHALPKMYDSQGRPTSILKSLVSLIKWISVSGYSHVIFASEGKNSLRKAYTQAVLGEAGAYKANRGQLDEDLAQSIKICDQFLIDVGFEVISIDGYEADDVIASVTHSFAEQFPDIQIHAFTGDKDLCQLYTYENYKIIDVKTKKLLGREYVFEKFGIEAEKFIDYQAIVGDTADTVSGVPGVGKVGAIKLLEEFGSLNNLLNNISLIQQKGVREKFEANWQLALLSRDLVYMRRHLINGDLHRFAKKFYDLEHLAQQAVAKYEIKY